MQKTLEDIFSQVEVSETGCLLWKGSTTRGYGNTYFAGKSHWMHRFFYERVKGPIPSGLTIDHLCQVKTCVNPHHLEVVTARENIRRYWGNKDEYTCPHGHAFTTENTIYAREGRGKARKCLTCHKKASSVAYFKRKARRGPLPPIPPERRSEIARTAAFARWAKHDELAGLLRGDGDV